MKSIKNLQSLKGKFQMTLDLFNPDIVATALMKQEPIAQNIRENWYLGHDCDYPEGYYYILRLDQKKSNWSLTYLDPFDRFFSIYIGLEVEMTGCHPDLWIGEEKELSPEPDPGSRREDIRDVDQVAAKS